MREREWDEPHCDNSGRCTAYDGDRGISNCIYCGKELHEKDGAWYTWDADQYDDPAIQDYVVERPDPARQR